MKNKKLKIIGIAVAALMVIAAVCAVAYHFRPVFEVGFFDDSIIVEARRAAADACESGNITVAEGQMVEIKADLRAEDTIRVELFPADDKEMTEPVFWEISLPAAAVPSPCRQGSTPFASRRRKAPPAA